VVIPRFEAGYLRVTHPFATFRLLLTFTFDLHVLGTPPAFILSQDQTLRNYCFISSVPGNPPRDVSPVPFRIDFRTQSSYHSLVVKVPALAPSCSPASAPPRTLSHQRQSVPPNLPGECEVYHMPAPLSNPEPRCALWLPSAPSGLQRLRHPPLCHTVVHLLYTLCRPSCTRLGY
jgi:hypothetical protein